MTGPAPLREARIDLAALRENVRILKGIVAPAELLAVVKAEGYGHGAEIVARAAVEAGADRLGVADIDEALALRAAGIEAPILSWIHGPDADFRAAIRAGVELGLSTEEQLEAVAELGGAKVQLKIDTGLNRNGFAFDRIPVIADRVAQLVGAGRMELAGVFSHFSNTSPQEDAAQLRRFATVLQEVAGIGLDPGLRHIASSQAAIAWPVSRLDCVRIGITMYGLPPAAGLDVE